MQKGKMQMAEANPEWKVYFSGNFFTHERFERPGQEWGCDAYSSWGGQHWYIPALYACSKGLVVDVCRMVERETLEAYRSKWAAYEGKDEEEVPEEICRQIQAEDPFELFDYRPEVTVNGRIMDYRRGAGLRYNPCFMRESASSEKMRHVMAHYGLDEEQGWEIRRWTFPWGTRRRPKCIWTASIRLCQWEQPHPAVRFHAEPGKVVQFAHPVTGVPCTLTVQSLEPTQLPRKDFPHAEAWDWPLCCVQMRYTLTPEVTEGRVQVNDLARNDQPVQRMPVENPDHPADAAIAIIGGADGPTAIFVAGKSDGIVRAAVSSAHFAPASPQEVEWEVVYYQKDVPDETVQLI